MAAFERGADRPEWRSWVLNEPLAPDGRQLEVFELIRARYADGASLGLGGTILAASSEQRALALADPSDTSHTAASVCAEIAADGMPVGLQIIGRSHGEDLAV
jgi:hypothetical protein